MPKPNERQNSTRNLPAAEAVEHEAIEPLTSASSHRMERRARYRKLTAVVLGVVTAVAGYVVLQQRSQVKVREVCAGIIYLDPATRTAAFEFFHPHTGQALEFSGAIPGDSAILIDGKPAELGELAVGDVVSLRHTTDRDRRIQSLRLTRAWSTSMGVRASGATQGATGVEP